MATLKVEVTGDDVSKCSALAIKVAAVLHKEGFSVVLMGGGKKLKHQKATLDMFGDTKLGLGENTTVEVHGP